MTSYEVYPIGKIRNTESGAAIEIDSKYIPAMKGLDGFLHINVIWWLSELDTKDMRNMLDTPQPYKNSPATMGIFATRSPIRPNPLALTAVEVLHIDYQKGRIHISYIDANDNTPILDIKPYTPSIDRVETPCVPKWCSHWPNSVEKSGDFDWENEFNF